MVLIDFSSTSPKTLLGKCLYLSVSLLIPYVSHSEWHMIDVQIFFYLMNTSINKSHNQNQEVIFKGPFRTKIHNFINPCIIF